MTHTHTGMHGMFGNADRYDRHAPALLGRLWRRVVEDVAALDLPAGALVVDVGTGPGRLPVAIAARCPQLRVEGIDVEPAMVERARLRAAAAGDAAARVRVEVGDVAALPYEDGSVAAVVSTMSQHHWPDRAAGFRELRRVLRPGGRVLVYDLRPLLRLAGGPARAAFEGRPVRSEPVRTSRLPVRVFARLSATG